MWRRRWTRQPVYVHVPLTPSGDLRKWQRGVLHHVSFLNPPKSARLILSKEKKKALTFIHPWALLRNWTAEQFAMARSRFGRPGSTRLRQIYRDLGRYFFAKRLQWRCTVHVLRPSHQSTQADRHCRTPALSIIHGFLGLQASAYAKHAICTACTKSQGRQWFWQT